MTERNASLLSRSVILSGARRSCCFKPIPNPSAAEGPAHYHREMITTNSSRFDSGAAECLGQICLPLAFAQDDGVFFRSPAWPQLSHLAYCYSRQRQLDRMAASRAEVHGFGEFQVLHAGLKARFGMPALHDRVDEILFHGPRRFEFRGN